MKKLLLLFIILSVCVGNSFATHNRAGEITYKHISGYTYGITVTTYTKFITGQNNTDKCELPVYFGDGDSAIAPRINGTPGMDCPGKGDGQMIATSTRLNIYYTVHTYSGPGNYIITMEDPNRNSSICNIPNSVNASFFLRTELKINPFLPPNSSPDLLNAPIDDACVGECFEHNPGAYDAEGDSLAYSLTVCYANGAPILGYTFPPGMSSGSIDPYTGDLVWCTPPVICQYNVAILISEYKLLPGTSRRYYVGSILRDMQITVGSCTNNAPKIDPLPDACVAVGGNLNFWVSATDPNANIVTLTSTGGPYMQIPAATFVSNPAISTVTGNFNWTPGCNSLQLLPYLVTFKATDSHPTDPLVDFESINIRVIASGPTGITATPIGSSIVLNWTAPTCSNLSGKNPLKGYLIYRKDACDPWSPGTCETGVPPSSGYKLIGTTTSATTFTDNNNLQGLLHGVDYSYIIVAFYADGSQSYASSHVCSKLVRDVPIITNVSVIDTDPSNGSIWTHWVKPLGNAANLDTVINPGPYEYRLMQAQGFNGGAVTYTQVASYTYSAYWNLTDTGFVSTGLNTQTFPYTYRVDFYSNGLFKGSTHTASSVFLESAPADNIVNLTWKEFVPWINYKYFIYKETPVASGTFVLLDSTTTQSYIDTALRNGVSYCYRIRSEGEYSDTAMPRPLYNMSQIKCEIPVDLIPPCQPAFTVSPDCDIPQNFLSWRNPNDYCSDDAVKYNIYFAQTRDASLQLVQSITNITDTTHIHVDSYEGLVSIAGCYAVTAVDSFGNESPVISKVCVDNCPVYQLPNVFTPNGDGKNDLFTPLIPYRYVKDVAIKIYDRWGLLMFETTDINVLWDGKNKSTKMQCSDGVYYYVCTVNEIRVDGITPRVLTGFVQLMNSKSAPGR